ncbi:hypothetical protein CC86DRAFT_115439 [Ophiobolus disseminans]|uniref:Uncharacterized protein n=1 Tax=Ophiobolus disseminans TaxID=1469910 RepID=A0A6A6ZJV1_9PLEO|nr:hypothetical protein CC86DRAFT_115439 [Ophiobolus disseminans]
MATSSRDLAVSKKSVPKSATGHTKRINERASIDCVTAAYDNVAFRHTIARTAFFLLRHAHPSLKPWQWSATVESANGHIYGNGDAQDCYIQQKDPYRVTIDNKDVHVRQSVTLKWACDSCRCEHKLENIPIAI